MPPTDIEIELDYLIHSTHPVLSRFGVPFGRSFFRFSKELDRTFSGDVSGTEF